MFSIQNIVTTIILSIDILIILSSIYKFSLYYIIIPCLTGFIFNYFDIWNIILFSFAKNLLSEKYYVNNIFSDNKINEYIIIINPDNKKLLGVPF